jgi:hypothetical protein
MWIYVYIRIYIYILHIYIYLKAIYQNHISNQDNPNMSRPPSPSLAHMAIPGPDDPSEEEIMEAFWDAMPDWMRGRLTPHGHEPDPDELHWSWHQDPDMNKAYDILHIRTWKCNMRTQRFCQAPWGTFLRVHSWTPEAFYDHDFLHGHEDNISIRMYTYINMGGELFLILTWDFWSCNASIKQFQEAARIFRRPHGREQAPPFEQDERAYGGLLVMATRRWACWCMGILVWFLRRSARCPWGHKMGSWVVSYIGDRKREVELFHI